MDGPGASVALHEITDEGVTLAFSAPLLENDTVRAAMPRSCLRCGAATFLATHVVGFSEQCRDTTNVEKSSGVILPALRDPEIKHGAPADILAKFNPVAGVPEPLNRVIPFWVCDLCEPAGLVFTQVVHGTDNADALCLIRFTHRSRALAFVSGLGGGETAVATEMRNALQEHPETPWTRLHKETRARIQEWFLPLNKEVFVLYVPDRRYPRADNGRAGIVVTSRRLLYRDSDRLYELSKGEDLRLSFETRDGTTRLDLQGPRWRADAIGTDRPCLMRLRRCLAEQKFESIWE